MTPVAYVTKSGQVRRPSADRVEQIVDLVNKGCLTVQIAEILGISQNRVRVITKEYGVTLNGRRKRSGAVEQ